MVTITRAAARAKVFETLYDSLKASLSAGTVTAAFIDDQPTYPQVVISPAKLLDKRISINRGTARIEGATEINVYAKKNKEIDQITDEIYADLEASEPTLKSAGIFIGDIEDTGDNTFFYNDQKIHNKTIIVFYVLNV